jgi:hypothetical protein
MKIHILKKMEENMKRTLFCGAFVFLLVCSCRTQPPVVPEVAKEAEPIKKFEPVKEEIKVKETRIPLTMPLTKELLLRIGGNYDVIARNISKYQLLSFGRITLEREYTEHPIPPVPVPGDEGIVDLEDLYFWNRITITDQTLAQAQKLENVDGEIVLSVGFEPNIANTLYFSSSLAEDNGYFYLKYPTDLPEFGEETGTVIYGGQTYEIKYGGEKKSYLLIKLFHTDIDIPDERELEGRKID